MTIRSALPLILLVSGMISACDPLTITALGVSSTVGMGAAETRGLEAAVDDTKIRAEINQLWLENNFSVFRNVTLTINEGRVLLTGSVPKPEQRIEAIRLAWQAAGVRKVIDEIQVNDQSGILDYARDGWIANKLRTNIIFDGEIKNINYTIDVVNGVAYLIGIAQNQDELDRVVAHARNVSGVKKVVNHVLLKDDPRRSRSQ